MTKICKAKGEDMLNFTHLLVINESKMARIKNYTNVFFYFENYYIALKFLEFMAWFSNMRHFFERHGFAVSSRFADRLGMRATHIRLFFIYLSFITLGVSFAFYLTLAFLLRLKDMVYTKRSSVFDL